MDWTEDQVSTLARLWQEGLSASHVARQLGGVSRNAVIGKIHRLGIALRATPVRFRAARGSSPPRPPGRSSGPCAVERPDRLRLLEFLDAELAPTATIRTLTVTSCRWPIGDPREADFGYCGRECASASVYCRGHAEVAFRRGASRQQSDRRLQRYLGGSRNSFRNDWR